MQGWPGIQLSWPSTLSASVLQVERRRDEAIENRQIFFSGFIFQAA